MINCSNTFLPITINEPCNISYQRPTLTFTLTIWIDKHGFRKYKMVKLIESSIVSEFESADVYDCINHFNINITSEELSNWLSIIPTKTESY